MNRDLALHKEVPEGEWMSRTNGRFMDSSIVSSKDLQKGECETGRPRV
jgi:hypothetical protein